MSVKSNAISQSVPKPITLLCLPRGQSIRENMVQLVVKTNKSWPLKDLTLWCIFFASKGRTLLDHFGKLESWLGSCGPVPSIPNHCLRVWSKLTWILHEQNNTDETFYKRSQWRHVKEPNPNGTAQWSNLPRIWGLDLKTFLFRE